MSEEELELLGYQPARLMFACRGRQQPTLWSITFAKVNFHACNEGLVRSGDTSGAVWPCGYEIIINIERGADLVRICKTKYIFKGAE